MRGANERVAGFIFEKCITCENNVC